MGAIKDITDKRFGRLVAINFVKHEGWNCACDCGRYCIATGTNLRNGLNQSCGCFRSEKATEDRTTHGFSGTTIHCTWRKIKERCYSVSSKDFKDYGGRGIIACDAIKSTPKSIFDLIGEKPKGASIDRIDNNGNYSCGECDQCKAIGWVKNIRWATTSQQQRNKRTSRLVTFNGETKCVAEWAELFRIPYGKLYARFTRQNMTPEQAFSSP